MNGCVAISSTAGQAAKPISSSSSRNNEQFKRETSGYESILNEVKMGLTVVRPSHADLERSPAPKKEGQPC